MYYTHARYFSKTQWLGLKQYSQPWAIWLPYPPGHRARPCLDAALIWGQNLSLPTLGLCISVSGTPLTVLSVTWPFMLKDSFLSHENNSSLCWAITALHSHSLNGDSWARFHWAEEWRAWWFIWRFCSVCLTNCSDGEHSLTAIHAVHVSKRRFICLSIILLKNTFDSKK